MVNKPEVRWIDVTPKPDEDITIVHKSAYCYLCHGGQTWIEYNGKPDRKLKMKSYKSPTEENPHREINVCINCKNIFREIAKELLKEEGLIKSKK